MLAHGVGGRQDLPIPFSYALIGAILALLVSFVALGALWRQPRLGIELRDAPPLSPVVQRVVNSRPWVWFWRVVGLVVAAYLVKGFFAADTADNPVPGMVYVLFWVGLVPLSLVFGAAWRGLNPLRTLHLLACRALRRDPRRGRRLPLWVGYWPAVVGLFGFVWLELVAPDRATLPVLMGFLLGYACLTLSAAVIFGARWYAHGDAFEVLSALLGRLAAVARRRDGTVVWRNGLDGMAGLRPAPGLVVFVAVLLGSTLYDSVSGAPFWVRFTQESPVPAWLTGSAGLVAVIAVVLGAYGVATGLAGRLGGAPGRVVAGELAHSVVPIAVGYLVAHYYSLFVLEGQRTVALLLGAYDWQPHAAGTSPAGIALLQVTVIVLGHVVGTVLAHDRALRLFPPRTAVLGQVPLLVLMVAYTILGLLLLFAA